MAQQKWHLQRMCKENKEVIGREKGTKEEIKPHDGSDVEGKIVEMSGEGEVRILCRVAKRKSLT